MYLCVYLLCVSVCCSHIGHLLGQPHMCGVSLRVCVCLDLRNNRNTGTNIIK